VWGNSAEHFSPADALKRTANLFIHRGENLEHIEGNFTDARNTLIYYQAWLPEGNVKAVLLIVHGLGEHSGRYMNVVNHFIPLGYAIYGFDHIGHGKSEGIREFVERFEEFTNTLSIYHNMVKGWQTGKPIFLLGHSLGGLIATDYLLDHQAEFRGAIISAPTIKVSDNISKATIILGKTLSVFAPKAGILALDATGVSRDSEVVTAYINDPLVFHGKTPARLAVELLKAMIHFTARMDKLILPFIVVQASEDKLVDPDGAQMLYDKASSKDKTIKIYEGMYHEVFNEPGRARVLKDVEIWLAARA
jgi:alpha-beta hydrolase superfamily lysophospholipase